MKVLYILLIAVLGYLLGSLNVSVLLSQGMSEGDVRSHGSGNAGATNMARVYGLRAGLLTLALDMLKALPPLWLGHFLLGDLGLAVGGSACFLGHCFPLFHRFKGGKGVSVGAAIALALDWRVFLVALAVFLIAAFSSKKVSLGSLCAAVALVGACLLFRVSTPKLVMAIFAAILAFIQHRQNIKRLAEGTEADFKAAPGKR